MTDHNESGHDEQSHGNTNKFLMVFVGLLILTAISFAVGSNDAIKSTPQIGWTIMMAVSCAKAMLVMLFFMHLKWEANWKYVLTIPASIMALFLLLMLFPDIKNRTDKYSGNRWLYAATPPPATEEHPEDVPPSHDATNDGEAVHD
jgi:cytochrome c oxidase subunit 4